MDRSGLRKIFLAVLSLACAVNGSAADAASSTGVLALAYNSHVGPADNSIAGATSFTGLLSSESSEGFARASLGFGATYASTVLTTGGTAYTVDRIGGEVRLGFLVHPFAEGAMVPVLAAYGILGADLLRSDAPPPGTSISEVALGFGYELEAGMSMKLSSKSRWRFLGAYRRHSAGYAQRTITLDCVSFRTAISF